MVLLVFVMTASMFPHRGRKRKVCQALCQSIDTFAAAFLIKASCIV